MQAAAHNKGGFGGVPQSVGKEFVGDAAVKGAGICICAADTGRVLFLKRSPSSSHAGEYDLPGGTAEDAELPAQTARRETREEIGVDIACDMEQLSDTTLNDVNYVTHYFEARCEFTPKLDTREHTEHVWAFPNDPPQPLHPGVALTLDQELAKDANPLSIAAIRLGHKGGKSTSPAKVAASRMNGAKHGSDAALAFDRESVRSVDADGRMRVAVSNISKAMVCPYLGSEIPNAELLGLEADKIYMLLRDPDELAKAAPTFNGVQLLSVHEPVNAGDPKLELTVGAAGTDCVFEAPYLKNSLIVWTQEGIDVINSGEQQEISCSYRYDADMTPGNYEGVEYSGVMRNIIGNHIAIVNKGRAGPDVFVGDSALSQPAPSTTPSRTNQPSKLEKNSMSKTLSKKALSVRGVLQAVLKPQFAADKMPDLDKILAGVDKKNYGVKKPLIVAAIKSHMAADADLPALVELLDALDGTDKGADDEEDDDLGVDADPVEAILAHCRGKLSDDEMTELESKVRAMAPAAKAEDEPAPFKGEPKVGEKPAEDEKDEEEKKDMVSKTAMDAAIGAASKAAEDRTIARINGIHEARKIAAPFVGEIAVACDSAEDVYRAALKIRGVNVEGVHASAFRAILQSQPVANAERVIAHDAAPAAGMDKFLSDLGLPA